jgi:hypothetical protein
MFRRSQARKAMPDFNAIMRPTKHLTGHLQPLGGDRLSEFDGNRLKRVLEEPIGD